MAFFQPQRGQIQRSLVRMSDLLACTELSDAKRRGVEVEGPSGFAPELVGPQPTVLLLHHGPEAWSAPEELHLHRALIERAFSC